MASEIQDLSAGTTSWVLNDDGTLSCAGLAVALGDGSVTVTDGTDTVVVDANTVSVTRGSSVISLSYQGVTATDGTNTRYFTPSGVLTGSGLQEAYCPVFEVTFEDDGATTLDTVPTGRTLYLLGANTETTVAWNGSSPDLDIGVAGGDTDGFIDGADLTLNGIKGLNADELGELLFDAGNNHTIVAKLPAGTVISALSTPGAGASAGTTLVRLFGFLVSATP